MERLGMSLGDIIRAYREKAGLSQSQFAKKAGMPQGTLSRIESNSKSPSTSNLLKIAQAMNVSVDDLLKFETPNDLPSIEQSEPEKIKSIFIEELDKLEEQLTPQQRAMVIKIAKAFAVETSAKNQNES